MDVAKHKGRYRTQVQEVINRHVVVSLALEQGFNAFLPVYDGGVDFILYREDDQQVRKVQLKGRWTIDKKYVGRDIWMAFPIDGQWHLMPHDLMLEHAEADGKTLKSASWIDGGAYSKPRPSAATIAECAPYKFGSIAQVAAQAADEANTCKE
jgi:hypothetical protein